MVSLGNRGLKTPDYGNIFCPEVSKTVKLVVGLGTRTSDVTLVIWVTPHFPSWRVKIDLGATSVACYVNFVQRGALVNIKVILASMWNNSWSLGILCTSHLKNLVRCSLVFVLIRHWTCWSTGSGVSRSRSVAATLKIYSPTLTRAELYLILIFN